MKYCNQCNATYEYIWNFCRGEAKWVWLHEYNCKSYKGAL